MKDLEKIKEIFLSKDTDEEEYQENLDLINEWEKDIIKNENLLSWQEHDITKDIISKTRESYINISLKIALARDLTKEELFSLWAKQDAMLWILSLSNDEPKIMLENINEDIRKALNP